MSAKSACARFCVYTQGRKVIIFIQLLNDVQKPERRGEEEKKREKRETQKRRQGKTKDKAMKKRNKTALGLRLFSQRAEDVRYISTFQSLKELCRISFLHNHGVFFCQAGWNKEAVTLDIAFGGRKRERRYLERQCCVHNYFVDTPHKWAPLYRYATNQVSSAFSFVCECVCRHVCWCLSIVFGDGCFFECIALRI